MSDAPDDRRYTESHEWCLIEGGVATVGISRHAVDQLNDVTFVEMKAAGTAVKAGDQIGEIESVKTTGEIYAPVAGEITEVNAAVSGNEALINEDPYGAGWLVKIRVEGEDAAAGLLDAETYLREHAG